MSFACDWPTLSCTACCRIVAVGGRSVKTNAEADAAFVKAELRNGAVLIKWALWIRGCEGDIPVWEEEGPLWVGREWLVVVWW